MPNMNFKQKILRSLDIARSTLRLGPRNLFRVWRYRRRKKHGLNCPVPPVDVTGKFFHEPSESSCLPATNHWLDKSLEFGWLQSSLNGKAPNWFGGLSSELISKSKQTEWWKLDDFDSSIGDIKSVWERSRFDWVLSHAQQRVAGTSESLDTLNLWLSDWLEQNPPYFGFNWKCGQEASIRVIHLAIAAVILGQVGSAETRLLQLVRLHMARIEPTLDYALAQDNNHGTSEAAALFIGGTWLQLFTSDAEADRWANLGRRWLIERVGRLIAKDGSFSQHSVNYHRLMLDTLAVAEVWRQQLKLKSFGPVFGGGATAATKWLRAFTDAKTGDAPNIGANDGASLLPLSDCGYRDFRPSVELASRLFLGHSSYPKQNDVHVTADWLGTLSTDPAAGLEPVCITEESQVLRDGGYAILRTGSTEDSAAVFARYPRFRFRPSHADALHVDLWVKSRNLLRDGGTYSYFAEGNWLNYFSGTQSHNTVQFDDRDQMPRIGRFLFGGWLKPQKITDIRNEGNYLTFTASYRDSEGATHQRSLKLASTELIIEDTVSGFKNSAVLRWRMDNDQWILDGNTAQNGEFRIGVKSDIELDRFEIVEGWESRFYRRKNQIPVLEAEVSAPCTLTTTISWN